jgi:hypothetical protein
MPLTLNVGLSKKIGQKDYGSLGATCNVQVELDGSVMQHDLETFHRHVKNAYVACSQAVNDELARQQGNVQESDARSQQTPQAAQPTNGTTSTANGHRASQKQLDYAAQLAGQIRGLGTRRLETLSHNLYGKPLTDLGSIEASGLIDVLKDIKSGKIDCQTALKGASS